MPGRALTAQISHIHGTQEPFGLFCISPQKDLDTAPYLHTKVPLARPVVESWSVTLNPGASTASALSPASLQLEWTLLRVVNCGTLPWIQHSWAGEHSSAWDSQLPKGDSSIIGALITPSLSPAPFCSADSTGRLEGFAVPQWLQPPSESFPGGKVHWHHRPEPRHQSRQQCLGQT